MMIIIIIDEREKRENKKNSFGVAYSNVMDGGFENIVEGFVVGAKSIDDDGFEFVDESVEVAVDQTQIQFGDVTQRLQTNQPIGQLRFYVVVVSLQVRVFFRPLSIFLQRFRQFRLVQFQLTLKIWGVREENDNVIGRLLRDCIIRFVGRLVG